MTRSLPLQPSPQFLSNQMVSEEIQQKSPTRGQTLPSIQTPTNRHYRSERTPKTTIKTKRPTYTKMIEEAIFENYIKRKGASLHTIKKYLKEKYDVDVKKSAKRICKCIREALSEGGNLKQITGNGANGTFALVALVRKRLQVKKEKLEIDKSTRTITPRSSKTKSAPSAPLRRRTVQKMSKTYARQTNTPVTRITKD